MTSDLGRAMLLGGVLALGGAGCWTTVSDRDTGANLKAHVTAQSRRDTPIAITRLVKLGVKKFDETRRIGPTLDRAPRDEPSGTIDLSGRVAACLRRQGYTNVTFQPDAAAEIYVAGEVGRSETRSNGWVLWDALMAVPAVVTPVPLHVTDEMPVVIGIYDARGRLLEREKRFMAVGAGGISIWGLANADYLGAISEAVCAQAARLVDARRSPRDAPTSAPARAAMRPRQPSAVALVK